MDSQLTQDEVDAKYEEFKKWIDEQPELPKSFGERNFFNGFMK